MFEYLEEKLACGDVNTVIKKFRHWPQTFDFTNKNNPFITPMIDSELVECKECYMVMEKGSLEIHMADHGQMLCQYCQNPFSYAALQCHLIEAHECHECQICQVTIRTSRDQHRSYHECPFCPSLVAKCSLMDHIEKDHSGRRCPQCPEGSSLVMHRKLIRHLKESEQHARLLCPFCHEHQFLNGMKEHFQDKHGLQCWNCCDVSSSNFAVHISSVHGQKMCPVCPKLITDKEVDVHLVMGHKLHPCNECGPGTDFDHINRHHVWKECPQCRYIMEEWAYRRHLLYDHSWEECSYCDYLADSGTALADHEKGHELRSCEECASMVIEDVYDEHLREMHGMKDCLFCTTYPLPPALLKEHIMDYHCQMARCPECNEFQTTAGMPSHLRDSHSWQKCRFCDDVIVGSSVQIHIDTHHKPVTCFECGMEVALTDFNQHLVNIHNYTVQPPANSGPQIDGQATKSTLANLSKSSIASGERQDQPVLHSAQNSNAERELHGKTEYCHLCQKDYKNLYEHQRRQHDMRKRDTQKFIEERVQCVDGDKTHSKSNVRRCKLCRDAKLA